MLDDPDEDYDISEEETSEDDEEDIDGPFASLSQLADISLAAEGKLKDLALSEQIRCARGLPYMTSKLGGGRRVRSPKSRREEPNSVCYKGEGVNNPKKLWMSCMEGPANHSLDIFIIQFISDLVTKALLSLFQLF